MVLVYLFAPQIAALYLGDSSDLIGLSSTALTFFFFAVPLMGINLVIANLFQATAKPKQATLISLGRGFVFVALGIMILPKLFPEQGIWASILFAETLTAIFSLSMLRSYKKRFSSSLAEPMA